MHYVAIFGDQEREVEIHELGPDRYQLQIDGETIEVDVRELHGHAMSCILGDQAYNIELERDPGGGTNLLVRGNVVHIEVLDLRQMRLRQAQGAIAGPEGPVQIASPMPGKVVAVLVKEGDEVAEGQGVVVVEAMKMENELKAPRAGVIRNLTATEGEAVDGGARLCVIE